MVSLDALYALKKTFDVFAYARYGSSITIKFCVVPISSTRALVVITAPASELNESINFLSLT